MQRQININRNIRGFCMVLAIGAALSMALSTRADDAPATQPTTLPADTAAQKEVRQQLIDWDISVPKMSLAELRKTFRTENDREAVYCDWLADENLEISKTEQAVRDKWGPAADAQFAHLVGFTSQEEDLVCTIKVDGNHAQVSWPDVKEMTPETLIKVDGHWYSDVHAMFDGWLKDNPTMETDRRSTGKVMKQARADIAADKFDDADSFVADMKQKLENLPPNN